MKVNQIVTFKGYEEALEPGQKPILLAGEPVKIVKVVDPETFQVESVKDKTKRDQAFITELEEADAPPVAAAPKLKKGKAPAAAPAPARELKVKGKGASTKNLTAKQIKEREKAAAAKEKAKAAAKAEKEKAKAEKAKEKEKAKAEREAAKAAKLAAKELKPLAISAYSEDVQKAVKTDQKALDAAKSLANRIQETFWTLGGVLSYIQRNKSYALVKGENDELLYAGAHGFKNYVENELDMKYRRAMYYVSIYETFSPLGVTQEEVLSLGWAKASDLVQVVNAKNVAKWIKRAGESTRDDLQAEIKTVKVKAGDGSTATNPEENVVTATTLKFRVFEDQGNVVKAALTEAKAQLGDDANDNAALAHIASEWLILNGSGEGVKPDIDTAFAKLENVYSLSTIVAYVKEHYKKA